MCHRAQTHQLRLGPSSQPLIKLQGYLKANVVTPGNFQDQCPQSPECSRPDKHGGIAEKHLIEGISLLPLRRSKAHIYDLMMSCLQPLFLKCKRENITCMDKKRSEIIRGMQRVQDLRLPGQSGHCPSCSLQIWYPSGTDMGVDSGIQCMENQKFRVAETYMFQRLAVGHNRHQANKRAGGYHQVVRHKCSRDCSQDSSLRAHRMDLEWQPDIPSTTYKKGRIPSTTGNRRGQASRPEPSQSTQACCLADLQSDTSRSAL